jgi:hypothetical protein
MEERKQCLSISKAVITGKAKSATGLLPLWIFLFVDNRPVEYNSIQVIRIKSLLTIFSTHRFAFLVSLKII